MKELAITAFDQLLDCAGAWRGSNRLHDPATSAPLDSLSTATIKPILDGKFVRMDYRWTYRGTPRQGSFLIGFETKPRFVTVHWIDTWHMGDKVMNCRGPADDGAINVLGSYEAPPGPDWHWRIVITPIEGRRLRIAMYNICPDKTETLAVEVQYEKAR